MSVEDHHEESKQDQTRRKYLERFKGYFDNGSYTDRVPEIVFATLYWCGISAQTIADKIDELYDQVDKERYDQTAAHLHLIAWGLHVPKVYDVRVLVASACIVVLGESLD